MATRKEREEFLSVLQDELVWPGVRKGKSSALGRAEVLEAGRLLLRHARTHGNLAVEECNGPPDWLLRNGQKGIDERAAHIAKRQERCEKRIREICADLGLRVELGGDPRGFTVKIHFPSGKYNTWGGRESGYGVPQ